ncbi:MAG: acetyl-CoA C-acetyltransferase [Aquihabitans sp.]
MSTELTEAYIFEAIRTPRGKGKRTGALHGVKPIDLVVGLIAELRVRFPDLDEDRISDLILGCMTPVGDQGMDIARTAATLAGLPDTVGGVQLNRFCGSGLESVNMAAKSIRSGFDELVIAGGVESMSRVTMGSDGGAMAHDPATSYDNYFIPQGIACDLLATINGISRRDVDEYAVRSQQLAAAAWSGGYFAKSVVPVTDINGLMVLAEDEHMRPKVTVEDLGSLGPAFAGIAELGGFDDVAKQRFPQVERVDHVHTAGNSSGIVDGAALVLVGSEESGRAGGLKPRARIVSAATSGADPVLMFEGPIPAVNKALRLAGLSVGDIDVFEMNEAFAAVALHIQKTFDVPDEKYNVNGGAIAMGHPLGATGSMLVGTVLDELERRDGRYGLITLCVAGGMGVATIIERIRS